MSQEGAEDVDIAEDEATPVTVTASSPLKLASNHSLKNSRFKIKIWNCKGCKNVPISLHDWNTMKERLQLAAETKVREEGLPKGDIGQGHWQEHSDGTTKTSGTHFD